MFIIMFNITTGTHAHSTHCATQYKAIQSNGNQPNNNIMAIIWLYSTRRVILMFGYFAVCCMQCFVQFFFVSILYCSLGRFDSEFCRFLHILQQFRKFMCETIKETPFNFHGNLFSISVCLYPALCSKC